MIRNGIVLTITLLLAGCAGLPMPSLPEEIQVIQLINYAQRVATMTPEQQRNEYSASNRAFAREKDAISRMRLALLLATPGASVQDAARASGLLESMVTPSDATSPLHSLARLLYGQLNERASEQKRASQMRDQIDARKEVERTLREQIEVRKDAERALREQIEARKEAEHTLREQIESLKEAERTLREQLEALKGVERTIMQRGQESQPRRR